MRRKEKYASLVRPSQTAPGSQNIITDAIPIPIITRHPGTARNIGVWAQMTCPPLAGGLVVAR